MTAADRGYHFAPRWAAPAMDVGLVCCAAGAGVLRELGARASAYLIDLPVSADIGVQVVAALLLLQRRHHPLSMGLAVAALSLITPTYAAIAAPYSVVLYGRGRQRTLVVSMVVLVCWFLGARGWSLDEPVGGPALIALSGVLGLYAQTRNALAQEVVQRAERAEREQDLLAEQAVSAERSRLASEMHDVVAHRINLMVLQAAALGVTSTSLEVRAAAEELRASGAAALAEMRDMIGMLRSSDIRNPAAGSQHERDDANIGEVAGHRDLESLITVANGSGVDVHLTANTPLRSLGPLVDNTVYRAVQECITNAAKHAPGSVVSVTIALSRQDVDPTVTDEPALQLTVQNTRPAQLADPDVESSGSGSGLQGLRRRVTLLAGHLDAGPDGEGGYRVRMLLPLEPRFGAPAPAAGGRT